MRIFTATSLRWWIKLAVMLSMIGCKDGLRVAQTSLHADEAELRAVKAIDNMGGRYERDDAAKGKPVIWASLWNTKVTDAGLKEVKGLKRLQTLDLHETQITDAGLKELVELKELRKLILDGTRVTDAGLKELTGLSGLKELTLLNTKVTVAGVAELKKALPGCKIERHKIPLVP